MTPVKFKFFDTEKKEWVGPTGKIDSNYESQRYPYELFIDHLGQTVQAHYTEYEGAWTDLMPHIKAVEWTGLYDSNKNPIYDQDIIQLNEDDINGQSTKIKGRVVWSSALGTTVHDKNNRAIVTFIDKNYNYHFLLFDYDENENNKLIIIGSALTHPELLEER